MGTGGNGKDNSDQYDRETVHLFSHVREFQRASPLMRERCREWTGPGHACLAHTPRKTWKAAIPNQTISLQSEPSCETLYWAEDFTTAWHIMQPRASYPLSPNRDSSAASWTQRHS